MAEAPIFTIKNASVTFGIKQLFCNIEMYINRGDKIALVGRNGSGKSTLLKVIAREIEADDAVYFVQPATKISYMPQEQDFSQYATLRDVVISGLKDKNPENEYKADILIEQLEILQKQSPKTASGGELKKAALAKALISEPDILLLDEPTNHLDLKGREALIDALNQYNGSVILITHDFHILQCVCDTLWIVSNKTCKKFDGDLEDYRKILLDEKPAEKLKHKEESAAPKEKKMSKSSLSFKIKKVEETLAKLYEEQKETEEKIASGGANTDYAGLNRRLNEILKETEEQESLWDTYSEQM